MKAMKEPASTRSSDTQLENMVVHRGSGGAVVGSERWEKIKI